MPYTEQYEILEHFAANTSGSHDEHVCLPQALERVVAQHRALRRVPVRGHRHKKIGVSIGTCDDDARVARAQWRACGALVRAPAPLLCESDSIELEQCAGA